MTRALAMATAALVEFGQVGGVASTAADLSGRLAKGTVVLIMSSGVFDNIHEKLLSAVRARRR